MIRTRFAPSPTGFMHIGNLRTALFSFLIAKHQNGKFILRIEDTDQKRYINGAIDTIYNTLKHANLIWDEGPDVGGKYGPYIQSERVKTNVYKSFALKLVEQGDAYFCFCKENISEETQNKSEDPCRNLSKDEIEQKLNCNESYVIRQKIPYNKIIKYHDEVYGDIEFNSNDLDDQILIKHDGFPTYNFANVIDDHLMEITDVVRGCEYLSSTPKYVLLYKTLGWDLPRFIHLPLINGKDEISGEVSKLSKRHGSTSFEQLINDGYLSEAILNYVAFLGWNPKTTEEFFSLKDLIENFKISGLNKSSAIFDYNKLTNINQHYISNLSNEEFYDYGKKFISYVNVIDWKLISEFVKSKIKKFTELENELKFILIPERYSVIDLLTYKNKVIEKNIVIKLLNEMRNIITTQCDYESELRNLTEKNNVKFGLVTWLLRVLLSGKKITILDSIQCIKAIPNDEKIKRLNAAIKKIKTEEI